MNSDLQHAAQRLKSWTIDKALPLWASTARLEDESWVEHLTLDGEPDRTAERRWRIMARQVYVYAKATQIGWYDGQKIAQSTYERMCECGYVHRVKPNGQVSDTLRDLYDYAFYVLAGSALYGLTKKAEYLDDTQRLIDWIEHDMAHPMGGWRETAQASLKDNRRQNPHMHHFEASLVLFEATQDPKHLRFARHVYDLFKTYFFDANTGTVSEFFTTDWTPLNSAFGHTVEPGHAVEWVWLLGQYAKATGVTVLSAQKALYERAILERRLFLNDEEDKSGKIRRDTKRLWVQTETIKAHLAMVEIGIDGAAAKAAATINALFGTYLKSDGTWHDQINAAGENVAKTIPTSTFYHILCMASEAERVAKVSHLPS